MWSPDGKCEALFVANMRWRGLEPPRPKAATRPSTWRVYQFRHQRAKRILPSGCRYSRSWKSAIEFSAEQRRDDDGQPREVALDDVRPALRRGSESHAAEAGVAPRVHHDERDERCRKQHLENCGKGHQEASRLADVEPAEARERIQKLLVTGDNRLKQGVSHEKVRETYEEALRVATEAGLEEQVRPLVEIRLSDLDRLV